MKILQVISTMTNNPELISEILTVNTEYYFKYKDKYKWSVSKDNQAVYYVHLYHQDDMTLSELSHFTGWENYNYASYNSNEFKQGTEYEIFADLYRVLENKDSGIDDIFDDILDIF